MTIATLNQGGGGFGRTVGGVLAPTQKTVVIPAEGSRMVKAAEPSSRDVHWDRPLTQLAESFAQDMMNFVGMRVFPVVRVMKESDVYWKYPPGTFWRNEMTRRAENTRAQTANYKTSDDRYFIDYYALAHEIADRRRAHTDKGLIAQEKRATRFLVEQALIDVELKFVFNWFKTGIWDFQVVGNAATSMNFDAARTSGANNLKHWSDPTATPIIDITDIAADIGERTGRRPNVLVLGRRVYDKLRHHPTIIGRIDDGQTTGVAMATLMTMAALFDLDEVMVMDAVWNKADEGQPDDNEYIGGNNALLVYRTANPSTDEDDDGSAGYTFVLDSELIPNAFDEFNSEGMGISQFYDRPRRCTVYEIDLAYDQKLSGASLGCFFSEIVLRAAP